jgi:hypothetical protein
MEEVLTTVQTQSDAWTLIFSYLGIGLALVMSLGFKSFYDFVKEKLTGKKVSRISWGQVQALREIEAELYKLTKDYKDNARMQFTRTTEHINNILRREARLNINALLAKKDIKELAPKEIRTYETISEYASDIMLRSGMTSFEENGWASKSDNEWESMCDTVYEACKSEVEDFFANHWESDRIAFADILYHSKKNDYRSKYDATMAILRKESIDYYKKAKELQEKIDTLEKEMKG